MPSRLSSEVRVLLQARLNKNIYVSIISTTIKIKIMTSNEFTYWLQGFFEISKDANVKELDEVQTQIIKDHLKLVFKKETPNRTWSDTGNHGTCGRAGTVDTFGL
jgi:DNA-directed RNA polymerase specialized sigma54-like protein